MSECPVCGQEYDSKRTDDLMTHTSLPELRADATACKTVDAGRTRTMYIHL